MIGMTIYFCLLACLSTNEILSSHLHVSCPEIILPGLLEPFSSKEVLSSGYPICLTSLSLLSLV
ncbi:hypothetical protein WG66_000374 [Moniliophthora roreri]|nr:hypothetical protein WG66_000374 [Moniliophthora roreri]